MADEQTKLKALIKKELQATDAEIALFSKSLDSFLFKELSKLLGPLEVKDYKSAEFQQVLGSLKTSLDQAGLKKLLERIDNIYGRQLENVRDYFASLGKDKIFSDVDLDIIQNLISYDVEKVATRVSEYVTDVKKTFQTAVLSGEVPDFNTTHEKFGPRVEADVTTELNTAVQGFSRAVTAGKAKDLGFDLFIYIGPDDDVTRDFCVEVLSKDPPIYTADEIDSLDNGQGLSVMTFGGGYNCRHQWRPITEEAARALGYDI